jgi:hypothetical protein
MLRPCLAVVRAARALACAAWRVSFLAVERVRRAVVLLGDLAAVLRADVERDVLRVDVLRERVEVERVLEDRVPVLRDERVERAGLRVVLLLLLVVLRVVFGVSAMSANQPLSRWKRMSVLGSRCLSYPSNICT